MESEEWLLAAVVGYAILLLIVGAFIWLRAAKGRTAPSHLNRR
jgi:hypothetical protein